MEPGIYQSPEGSEVRRLRTIKDVQLQAMRLHPFSTLRGFDLTWWEKEQDGHSPHGHWHFLGLRLTAEDGNKLVGNPEPHAVLVHMLGPNYSVRVLGSDEEE